MVDESQSQGGPKLDGQPRLPASSGGSLDRLTSMPRRKRVLEAEVRFSKRRLSLRKANGAAKEMVLTADRYLQACQEELAQLQVEEEELLSKLRRHREPPKVEAL